MHTWIAERREEMKKQIVITLLVGILVFGITGVFIVAVESRISQSYRIYDLVAEPTVDQIQICEGLCVEIKRFKE